MTSRSLKAIAALCLTLLLPGAAAAQGGGEQGAGGVPLSFEIPGLESVNSDSFSTDIDGTITFSGYVDIRAAEWRVQADRVIVTPPADPDAPDADWSFEATGNVAFDAGEIALNGTRMVGSMLSGSGSIENGIGIGPGGVYFRGDLITQRAAGIFRIENGVVTPCTQALPIWEFSARSFDLHADDHVTMKWPVFKVKGMPLIVLPALYWPIDKGRRATGLLIPNVGTSSRKGWMFSQPLFWAINRSMDATFAYDYYSKAGSSFTSEYRHHATENSIGRARFFWLQGSNFSDEELANDAEPIPGGWTLDGEHLHNLGGGWRVNANANFFSSREFVQGFEDDFNRFLRRNSSIGGFITRSWSSYTLNVVADNNETFFGGGNSVVRRRLPEVEFRVRRRPIAEPLYFQLEGSYAGLLREERSANRDPRGGRYQRLDALPEVSLALTQIPWLTFNPFLAWRSTYYDRRSLRGEFEDEPIFRNVYETGIQVIGPSIFRIFDTPASGYSPRYKHLLEPRFTWGRLKELEHENFRSNEIIQFDEIDRFGGDRHFARMSLTSRFLAKRFNTPEAEQRTVWEVFSVALARDFDLRERDEDIVFPRIPLPWSVSGRVTPTPAINFGGGIRFTPDWQPGGFTVNGSMRSDEGVANITWFRNSSTSPNADDPAKVDVESRDRLSGTARYNLLRRLVTLRGNLTWDVSERLLQAYSIGGTWNTQCCSIGGQLRQNKFSFRDDIQFSFIIELLNVGQFGFGDGGR